MSAIKEFREFFLRNIKVITGSKKDQENNFPTKYTVKGKSVFNRFLKGHYPSESVFQKLFESLTFKLNQEDTATENVQGLVKRTVDQDAINRVSRLSGFTTVIEPHQLPEIITQLSPGIDTPGTPVEGTGIIVTPVTRLLPEGQSRLCYLIENSAVSSGGISGYLINIVKGIGEEITSSLTLSNPDEIINEEIDFTSFDNICKITIEYLIDIIAPTGVSFNTYFDSTSGSVLVSNYYTTVVDKITLKVEITPYQSGLDGLDYFLLNTTVKGTSTDFVNHSYEVNYINTDGIINVKVSTSQFAANAYKLSKFAMKVETLILT